MTRAPLNSVLSIQRVCVALISILGIKLSFAAAIAITEQQALNFGPIIAYITQDIVIAAADSDAAVFDISGDAYAQISIEVTNNRINMVTGSGNGSSRKILVNQWSYGGAVDTNGLGTLDQFGSLANIRVGATAAVKASNIPGPYSASGTVRITYQ
ncbi:MAG: hypothetical protein COB51_10670 [Moraxellaceae bacterium]|nr:MAG: hypothetical protein COB51_10670 [Moraxellaceae bacterium]